MEDDRKGEDDRDDLQTKALCVATGAFRTTAAAVLETETGFLPIKAQIL
jgi:hypothetical protein